MRPRLQIFLGLFLALALLLGACTASGGPTLPPPATAAAPTNAGAETTPDGGSPTSEAPADGGAMPTSMPQPSATLAVGALPPNNAGETPASPTLTPSAPLEANAIPDPAGFTWRLVAGGLRQPLYLTTAPDGSGRWFIVLQSGRIRLFSDGQMLETPFLDISDRTSRPRAAENYGERGLLGLAFHPRYAENGYFYLNYTDLNGDTVVSRFQVSANDPNQADPASEQRLLYIQQPYPNHNGGMLAFGPDGYLYVGLGDGGSAGDPENYAQSNDTLLGKILRLDVDNGSPYAIPANNPYVNGGGEPEIWATGLRNPWRFSFDRLNGDLYIGDVGQNRWEEINYLPASQRVTPGAPFNFGWRYFEGSQPYTGDPGSRTFLAPVAEYGRALGCSVTGGVVYRGPTLPEWQGVYLYGDYCSGRVWALRATPGGWSQVMAFDTGLTITSFGQDDAGEVYLLDFRAGDIYRLERK